MNSTGHAVNGGNDSINARGGLRVANNEQAGLQTPPAHTGGFTMRRNILTLEVTQGCIDRAGRGCHNCPVALSALRAGLIKPRIYSVITGNIIGGHAHDRVNYNGVDKTEHQRILDFIRAYDGGEKVAPTTFRIKAA